MKTQSKGPGQPTKPSPKQEAIEEKITTLTQGVAKTANQYKVMALVAILAVFAIVAISQLVGYLGDQKNAERTDKIYSVFSQEDPAAIRAQAPLLQRELKGTNIEPYFALVYSRWLFGENEGNDRQAAIDLLKDTLSRHEGDLYLTLAEEELSQIQGASAGFTLPEIPTPEGDITPLLPNGAVTPGTTPPSDDLPGDTSPGAAPADTNATDTGSGDASTDNTTEPTPPAAPTSQPAGDGGR